MSFSDSDGFAKYQVGFDTIHNGVQYLYRFPNGFGASVVKHDYSYGSEDGLWEVARIKWGSTGWEFTTNHCDSGDITGWHSDEDVSTILAEIQDLGLNI